MKLLSQKINEANLKEKKQRPHMRTAEAAVCVPLCEQQSEDQNFTARDI
jgi:hypothetical protein